MTDFRALCAELLSALESEGYAHWVNGPDEDALCLRARVALADKSADADQVLNLAAIIREVDGNNSKGAAALAESILEHPGFRAVLARWGNPAPLADTHYEWELEDANGEWQAGGSSNSQSDVEREGMRYLHTYTQDGPHKLIIRQHTTQTINEIAHV